MNNSGLTQNQAMGGLGISYGDAWSVNQVNPALSVKNNVFNFQAAFNYKRFTAETENSSATLDGGGLSYVTVSLPIKPRKWTVGLGLNQISSVDYEHLVTGPVVNSNLNSVNRINGNGGISEVYLSTGLELFKNLNIGLQTSYIFGATIRRQQLTLEDEDGVPTGISSEYYERTSLNDFSLKGGLHYEARTGDRSRLNFGAIYQVFGDLTAKQFAKMADFGEADDPDSNGQLIFDNEKGNIYLPNKLGYGVSFEKINKFVIGLEAQHQDFRDYRSFTGENSGLGESFKIGLGGQFVPDIYSLESIFMRSTFRAGIEFEQTPYLINQNKVNDIGINFGASVPMNNLSLLNLAVKLGQRGATDNGLVRENYVKFSLGFSINDNSWFYKRVFE
ncbi:membrane protein [Echinicola sediminis]